VSILLPVIPVKTGIQFFPVKANAENDAGLRRHDELQ